MAISSVLLTVLFILFNLYLYQMKHAEISKAITEDSQKLQKMQQVISQNIANVFLSRLESMTKFEYFALVKEDLQNDSFERSQELTGKVLFHFENFKDQNPHVKTLHLITKSGKSYLRAHNKKNRDDLTLFRPSIKSQTQVPVEGAFFENGVEGFLFRIVKPLYHNDALAGFIELGVDTEFFIRRINRFGQYPGVIFIRTNGEFETYKNIEVSPELLAALPQRIDFNANMKIQTPKGIYYTHPVAMRSFDGDVDGYFLFLEDYSFIYDEIKEFFYFSAAVSAVLLLVLLFALDRAFTLLLKKMDRLFFIINQAKDFIVVSDKDAQKILFINDSAQRLLGYSKQELKALPLEDLVVFSKHDQSLEELLSQIKTQKDVQVKKFSFVTKAGQAVPIEGRFSYVEKDEGYIVAICKDITDTLQMQLRQRVNEEMINKYIPLSHTDLKGVITYANEALTKLTGYSNDELVGKNHRLLRSPETKDEVYENLWNTINADKVWRGEFKIVTKDGSDVWVKILIEPRYDIQGNKIGYVSTREDVSDKEHLRELSENDQLTKAYNRRSFEAKLANAIKKVQKTDKKFGIVMFDIDHFKKVNDVYGHQVGDAVLQKVSKAVKGVTRESDFFARWGGEEFMLLVDQSSLSALQTLVQKIRQTISETDFTPVHSVTASFGITVYKDGDSADSIVKRVDEALYKAKENGRNRYETIV